MINSAVETQKFVDVSHTRAAMREHNLKIDTTTHSFVPDNQVKLSDSPKSQLVGDLIKEAKASDNSWKKIILVHTSCANLLSNIYYDGCSY